MAAYAPNADMKEPIPETYAPLVDPEEQKCNNFADEVIRQGFVRKVYGILTAQLLVTVAVAAPITFMGNMWIAQNTWISYASLGMMVACLCVMMCCQDMLRTAPANYIFLFVFSVACGAMVGVASAVADPQTVFLAASITALIFVGMTVLAFTTKIDFTAYTAYFVAALLALVVFGFVISMMSLCGVNVSGMRMAYDAIGILLFTLFIVYDTQMIIGGNHKQTFEVDDYVFAALNLYLDIINLFLMLLELLKGSD